MNPLPDHRNNLKIVTRDGAFHVGQVFAFATLALAYDGFRLRLVRSSDPAELADADIVFDTGGCYDPQRRRFDPDRTHGPAETGGSPRGAFGVIWQHLGLLAVSSVAPKIALPEAVAVWSHVDVRLVRPIDARGAGPACTRAQVARPLDALNLLCSGEDVSDDAFFDAARRASMLVRRAIIAGSVDQSSDRQAGSLREAAPVRLLDYQNRCAGARSCRRGATLMAATRRRRP